MKSCENCFYWCGKEQGCDCDDLVICKNSENRSYWKPNYQTLYSENSELKQELESRERMIEERNRIIRLQVDWVDEARKERDKLKRELEDHKKALEMMAKVKLYERTEIPYEDDIKAEMEWFLGTARRSLSR